MPSEPLALAVAQEWEAQDSILRPSLMHLVTFTCIVCLDTIVMYLPSPWKLNLYIEEERLVHL